MSSSTYAGVMREVPVVPLPVGSGSTLVRGMVVQWNAGAEQALPWVSGSVAALGVCTSDPDHDLNLVDVYCGKGASVLIKCDNGIVPNPNDFLYYSSPGVVSNTASGSAFAWAIGVGFNGYIEAIII
jgi:hypothetical protein